MPPPFPWARNYGTPPSGPPTNPISGPPTVPFDPISGPPTVPYPEPPKTTPGPPSQPLHPDDLPLLPKPDKHGRLPGPGSDVWEGLDPPDPYGNDPPRKYPGIPPRSDPGHPDNMPPRGSPGDPRYDPSHPDNIDLFPPKTPPPSLGRRILGGAAGGAEIGGIIIGIIGSINRGAGNLLDGTLKCIDLISNGTSLINAVSVGAREVRGGAAGMLQKAEDAIRDGHLPPECLAALEALIGELAQLVTDAQDLIDSADAWLGSLAKYDCASDANAMAYIPGSSIPSQMLSRQIGEIVKSLSDALQEMGERIAELQRQMDELLAGNCGDGSRRSRPRPCPAGTVGVPYRTPSGQLVYNCVRRNNRPITDA
jgi:hypothetical protein